MFLIYLAFATVVPLLVTIGGITGLVVYRRRTHSSAVHVLALAAVTFAAMLVTLSYGIWSGGLMDFRSASELCGGELAASPTQSLLPLRNTCVFEDGSVRRLVPALVNPALVALLAVSGILTGCSAYLRRHAIALR
jgi:hypothetical protein